MKKAKKKRGRIKTLPTELIALIYIYITEKHRWNISLINTHFFWTLRRNVMIFEKIDDLFHAIGLKKLTVPIIKNMEKYIKSRINVSNTTTCTVYPIITLNKYYWIKKEYHMEMYRMFFPKLKTFRLYTKDIPYGYIKINKTWFTSSSYFGINEKVYKICYQCGFEEKEGKQCTLCGKAYCHHCYVMKETCTRGHFNTQYICFNCITGVCFHCKKWSVVKTFPCCKKQVGLVAKNHHEQIEKVYCMYRCHTCNQKVCRECCFECPTCDCFFCPSNDCIQYHSCFSHVENV